MIKPQLRAAFFICVFLTLFSVSAFAEPSYDGYIVKFKDEANIPSLNEQVNTLTPAIPSENIYGLTNETEDYIELLKNSGDVEYIEPNYIMTIPDEEMEFGMNTANSLEQFATLSDLGFTEPNDPLYSRQWQLSAVNAGAGWAAGASDKKIRIAVIDSGDPSRHPDITLNVGESKDYTGTSVYDTYGHSTFISGLIGANTNNNLGIAGILENVEIIPLKVCVEKNTTFLTIATAMNDAIDLYDCDVINLSLCSDVVTNGMLAAIQKAVDNNIIVVAAVGNSGASKLLYPAACDGVIGVGSVTRTLTWASHSQHNASVDVAAPGFGVYSTYLSNSSGKITYSYTTGTGTSYAAPHVAAAAAVAKYLRPDINHDEFMEVLENTCVQNGAYTEKNDYYGYGLVNIEGIINYLTAEPLPSSSPSEGFADEESVFISSFTPTVNVDDFSSLTTTLEITNNSDESVTGNLYLVSYTEFEDHEGNVFNIPIDTTVVNNITVSANSVNSSTSLRNLTCSLDSSGLRSYVKVYFWDENMQPLTEPFEYEIKY